MISFNSYKAAQASSSNSMSSTENSPKKYNLLFSFNFDENEVDSDNSTDSENADLRIDVAEMDDIEQPKKRRRAEEYEISVLNEMEQELERQLDAKAAKTNLTATNVKNILKHVITNEHVLAMVQNRLHNTEDNVVFEPKLTRAKAKELAKTQPNIPWPMTPVKKLPSSEVQALIADELSEDSSDEEYKPEEPDPQSEDEGDGNLTSDLDSQPPTPVVASGTGPVEQQTLTAADINYDVEGVFKIPNVPHVPTEEESIGHRTRSKLSLNETSIEQIEQSFIPPDITTDMYDWDGDIDEEWDKFLKEFTKPLPHEPNVDDDPEADPEYNILEDRESELLDKEELRVDNGVKVTRKELNDLVAELFEFEDMFSKGQIEQPKKKKSADNSMNSTTSNPVNNSMIDLIPALAEPELPELVDSKLRSLLAVQFEQHVQLMTQHYVMSYMHPEFHSQSIICKENLESIRILQDGEHSAFNVKNLDAALTLISNWEAKFEDEKFHARFLDNLQQEIKLGEKMFKNRLKYYGELDPSIRKLFLESEALMYPELLPITTFRTEIVNTKRTPYLPSEKRLLLLGLSEFIPFVEAQHTKFKGMTLVLQRATGLIHQYLMPNRSPEALRSYITACCRLKTDNPIKKFFETRQVSSRIHCIADDYEMKAPKDHPISSLPMVYQKHIEKEKNKKYDSLESLVSDLSNSKTDFLVDEDLLTHTVNMMPSMSLRETGKKSGRLSAITENVENKESTSDETSQQMRKTTPRLAKTRSVQNMKLKSQISGSKNSQTTEALFKSNTKNESLSTPEEPAGSTKGDNEDEIAELMLASTTIKKDTVNRKKAKQVRESENIKRMLEAEKELGQEERATKFAASFMQKLHMTLESSNPELLRSVIKLYLEYSEKLEKSETESDNKTNNQNEKMSIVREAHDRLAINLYKDVCEVLKDHPEMYTDFLLFLKPHQAAMIDKLVEHTMLQKMLDFINAAQVYFAKQPSRMARVMQAITQLATEPNVTLETVHATMDPVLKGHPLIMDMFQQIIPSGKPPESLFAASLFENLTCPVLPHDKHRTFSEDAPELYENIELPTPTTQDDPYGGDNCKCDCHETNDSQSKTVSEHCISCGVRFLNGRVYLQTSEGLRPAKVTFPGDDDEKFENIARVSLKTTEKFVPAPPTGRRRKSSKNDLNTEEVAQKQCPLKSSPVKDNDDGDRGTLKTKRGVKSPPKVMDQRRYSKSSEINSNSISSVHSHTEVTSPLKSKREKRAERREAKTESKSTVDLNNKFSETAMISNDQEECTFKNSDNTEEFNNPIDNGNVEGCIGIEVDDINFKSTAETSIKSEVVVNNKPWTRQEDALLLQNIQEDYSERTFVKVSETLGNRTVQQVKERCQILLSLLEKMVED
ncbi:GON-4-like protein [Chelonus insularis]|uniref:GON-4-like protein n=1 Tax=Chelonus insularis TaxID=460826 RepID=UPI00158909E9|nr:GON-4-like protein [Chelonus insularis]